MGILHANDPHLFHTNQILIWFEVRIDLKISL